MAHRCDRCFEKVEDGKDCPECGLPNGRFGPNYWLGKKPVDKRWPERG